MMSVYFEKKTDIVKSNNKLKYNPGYVDQK